MKFIFTFYLLLLIPINSFAKKNDDDHKPLADLKLILYKTKHYAPMPVDLDASKSKAKDGKTLKAYEIDFGDGSPIVTKQDSVVRYVYEILDDSRQKKFVVTLRVQDSDGVWSEPNKKTLILTQIPEPGPTNNSTLLGVDIDGNGIRDDVDSYINSQFKNNTTVQRQAIRQLAKFYQTNFVASDDKQKLIDLFKNDGSIYCLTAQFPNSNTVADITHKIQIQYVNTDLRADAFSKIETNRSGMRYKLLQPASLYPSKCSDF